MRKVRFGEQLQQLWWCFRARLCSRLSDTLTTSQTLSCSGESDPLFFPDGFTESAKSEESTECFGARRLNCSGVIVVEFHFQKYFFFPAVAQLVSNPPAIFRVGRFFSFGVLKTLSSVGEAAVSSFWASV